MAKTKTEGITGSSQYADIEDVILDLHVYRDTGVVHSDFLRAVLENNLKETFNRADDRNLKRLRLIVMYLYNRMPSGCWGNKEKVEDWRRTRGLAGKEEEEA